MSVKAVEPILTPHHGIFTLPLIINRYLGGGKKPPQKPAAKQSKQKQLEDSDDQLLNQLIQAQEEVRKQQATQDAARSDYLQTSLDDFNQVVVCSGRDNNCFFHALQAAGIAITRAAVIDNLREVLRGDPDFFTEHYGEAMNQEIRDAVAAGEYVLPRVPPTTQAAVWDDYLLNHLGAFAHNGQGFNMIAFTTHTLGLIDVIADIQNIEIQIVMQTEQGLRITRRTMPLRIVPGERQPLTVTLLYNPTNQHFDLLTNETQDRITEMRYETSCFDDLYENSARMFRVGEENIETLLSFKETVIPYIEAGLIYYNNKKLNQHAEKIAFLTSYLSKIDAKIGCFVSACDLNELYSALRSFEFLFSVNSGKNKKSADFDELFKFMYEEFDISSYLHNFFTKQTSPVTFTIIENNPLKGLLERTLKWAENLPSSSVVYPFVQIELLRQKNTEVIKYSKENEAEDEARFTRDTGILPPDGQLIHYAQFFSARMFMLARLIEYQDIHDHDEAEKRIRKASQTKKDKKTVPAVAKAKKIKPKNKNIQTETHCKNDDDDNDAPQAIEAPEHDTLSEERKAHKIEVRKQRAEQNADREANRAELSHYARMQAWWIQTRARKAAVAAAATSPAAARTQFNQDLLHDTDPDYNVIYAEIRRIGGNVVLNQHGNNRHALMWEARDGTPVIYFFDNVHGAQDVKGDKAAAITGLKKRLRETGRLGGEL